MFWIGDIVILIIGVCFLRQCIIYIAKIPVHTKVRSSWFVFICWSIFPHKCKLIPESSKFVACNWRLWLAVGDIVCVYHGILILCHISAVGCHQVYLLCGCHETLCGAEHVVEVAGHSEVFSENVVFSLWEYHIYVSWHNSGGWHSPVRSGIYCRHTGCLPCLTCCW